MPRMRAHTSRRGMITSDDQYIGLERRDARDQWIDALDCLYLGRKVTIFATRVDRLEMYEVKIVLVEVLTQDVDAVLVTRCRAARFHPHQPRHAAIHRILRD